MWYNQTEVATKTELENVKGMIDVSARLVGTYSVNEASSYTIPISFDYLIVRTSYYEHSRGVYAMGGSQMVYITTDGSASAYGEAYSSYTSGNTTYSGYMINLLHFIVKNRTISFTYYDGTAKVRGVTIEAYKYQ